MSVDDLLYKEVVEFNLHMEYIEIALVWFVIIFAFKDFSGGK
jgi:hypothetical protein